jgi:hypothetical protein
LVRRHIGAAGAWGPRLDIRDRGAPVKAAEAASCSMKRFS